MKAMFVTAVARPIFDGEGNFVFDGKIGCWPVVDKVPAKINSKSCQAGTIENKSVPWTSGLYTEIICDKLILAAVEKMKPLLTTRAWWERKIIALPDNPHTHFKENNKQRIMASQYKHSDKEFYLMKQPPNHQTQT